jgi:hypothetical protein
MEERSDSEEEKTGGEGTTCDVKSGRAEAAMAGPARTRMLPRR